MGSGDNASIDVPQSCEQSASACDAFVSDGHAVHSVRSRKSLLSRAEDIGIAFASGCTKEASPPRVLQSPGNESTLPSILEEALLPEERIAVNLQLGEVSLTFDVPNVG